MSIPGRAHGWNGGQGVTSRQALCKPDPPWELTAIALQSGSRGNCIYVETACTAVLIDAGLPVSTVVRRLAEHGRAPGRIAAVVVSHDHGDHVRHAGAVQRKFGVPLFITEGSLRMARRRFPLGAMSDVECFRPGATLTVGDLHIETVPTPHDGTQGVAFVVATGRRRIGILTDLGHPFAELGSVLGGLDGVFLESNHDESMLERGSYPAFLKRRVRGPHGHLSNREAAELLGGHAGDRLCWACLAHLSGENNDERIAVATHREVLGGSLRLHVARRDSAIAPLGV